ncbi:MAG: class I SAM-dependent methyltransferase [Nocardioides sp.]
MASCSSGWAHRQLPDGPVLEIGSYCGKSAVYLGAAARAVGGTVFTVDHHRGSAENQAGWEHHDPTVVDPETGLMDTAVPSAHPAPGRVEGLVVAVADPPAPWQATGARRCRSSSSTAGTAPSRPMPTYEGWAPWVQAGGVLALHDVFPNPADGGRPPYEVYRRAVDDGDFTEVDGTGSLRVLRRVRGEAGDPVG